MSVADLSPGMRLKLSTVSDTVRKLTEQGLVEHAPYGSVSLTHWAARMP